MKVAGRRFYSIISLLILSHVFHIPWLLIWHMHGPNHCFSNLHHICITSKVNSFSRNIVNILIFTPAYFHFYLFSLQKCSMTRLNSQCVCFKYHRRLICINQFLGAGGNIIKRRDEINFWFSYFWGKQLKTYAKAVKFNGHRSGRPSVACSD